MGNFYGNIVVCGAQREALLKAMQQRPAYISPSRGECAVVYDAECDEQDREAIAQLSSELSQALECRALAAIDHDDSLLWLQLWDKGQLLVEYNSNPDLFDEEPGEFTREDTALLCSTLGAKDAAGKVEEILSASDEEYPFAIMRHLDLLRALGLPEYCAGYGYNYLSMGEFPPGMAEDEFVETGA